MKKITITVFTLLSILEFVQAQDFYGNILDIPVEVQGQQLPFPFSGGMNNPQPNAIDLNQDGIEDLYVFDRTGRVGVPFIKEFEGDSFRYRYAPSYARYFPEDIGDWVLLRDYDGDGIKDLFTNAQQRYAIQGVVVFKGYYESNRIAFREYDFDYPGGPEVIPIRLNNGTITQLFISNVDYPGIDDMDCDGDLDILTFNLAGGFIELYSNLSVEMGYGRDSLIFERTDACWGGVLETSIMPDLLLSGSADTCVSALLEQLPIEERHPGSTLLTFDADADGLKDLLLGDITYGSLNLLSNKGSCDDAWITDQDAAFPSYDVSVDLPVFPASFYVDVNGDGTEDLLASPNAVNGSENLNTLWYYENLNTVDEPVFEFRQNDFLVEGMLDFGTGSKPAFFDYNADGLLDLVVGTDGYFEPFGQRDTRLFLLENVGTSTSPAFRLVDEDYLSLSIFDANYAFAPTFGDMDNDGDLDILVGENSGQLFYAENTAGAGNPSSFGNWQFPYQDIDVGLFSVPAIADLDRDGLPDLIVGEQNVPLNFFKNTGTSSDPAFNPDPAVAPNSQQLGQINLAVPGFTTAFGAPVFLDQDGTYIMIVGTKSKGLVLYNNIEGNLYGTYDLNTTNLGNIIAGERLHPAIADIDDDGKLELIVGNDRGGLNAFQTDLSGQSTSSVTNEKDLLQFDLFPNPAKNQLNVRFNIPSDRQLIIYNGTGQMISSHRSVDIQHQIDISNLPAGLYFVELISGQKSGMKRIIVE